MMTRFPCWIGLFSFLSLSLLAVEPFGGSDGPTPFLQVPAPRKVLISLEEPVSTFSFLERGEKILYVSSQKRLKLFNLVNGTETFLGNFEGKLFPWLDDTEKYLLSADLRILKEVNTKSPGKEFWLPPTSDFYFWNDHQAFLQRGLKQTSPGSWSLDFLMVNPQKNAVFHHSCQFDLPESIKNLNVAQGHRYPEVLLYSHETLKDETNLSFHFLKLKPGNSGKCQVISEFSGERSLKGPISSVSWISESREIAVITGTEANNLYFGPINDLQKASIPKGYSYLPNPQNGVVLNINRQRGISVYSLHSGKFFNLDIPVDRGFFEGNQIWIDSEGDKLFLSTRDLRDKLGGRTLFTLSLRGL